MGVSVSVDGQGTPSSSATDAASKGAQMAAWVMVIIVVLTIMFVVVPWVIMFVVWGRYRGSSTWKLSGVILNLLFGPLVSFILWLFRPKPAVRTEGSGEDTGAIEMDSAESPDTVVYGDQYE